MAAIKTGIVAFGLAGRNLHYRALVDGLSDMVEVVAVFNRSPINRAGSGPDDFPVDERVIVYDDYDAFLAHEGLEVVHVSTPSGLHRDYVIAAAAAKKHVICDKPLEVTLTKADDCIAACRENGVALSVNFQQRFNPHATRLKEAIGNGLFGDPVSGSTEILLYRDPEYYTKSSWHGKLALDGGAALINQGIHYIDLLQWLMGSPVAEITIGVAERLVHTYIEAEDFGYAELTLANGAEMTITGGTCFRPGIDQRLEIRGTRGWVRLVNGVITRAFWDGEDRMPYFGAVKKVASKGGNPAIGLDNHIRYFRTVYDAITSGASVPVTGEEARKSLEIVLGIYKAWETKGAVRFPLDAEYVPSLGS